MAFKKVGDDMPVLEYYGNDGTCEKCPKCGSKLITIAVDNTDDNKLVCEKCDLEENDVK